MITDAGILIAIALSVKVSQRPALRSVDITMCHMAAAFFE